jgi:hypothetical protein
MDPMKRDIKEKRTKKEESDYKKSILADIQECLANNEVP